MDEESWESRTPKFSETEIKGPKKWFDGFHSYKGMEHDEGVTTLPDGIYYRCQLCEEDENTRMTFYKNREELLEHIIDDHEYLDGSNESIVEVNENGDLIDYSSDVEEKAKEILDKKGINIRLRYEDATLVALNEQMEDIL